ncbi:hypothetical protein TNCV_1163691 [Trichonephila clavipes]|nr:hypothetical protein TNCV_1163691 [Trichonephila clavipes]
MGPDNISMDDNERRHITPIVDGFHEGVNIHSMNCPLRSSDPCSNENVWDGLGKAFLSVAPLPGPSMN